MKLKIGNKVMIKTNSIEYKGIIAQKHDNGFIICLDTEVFGWSWKMNLITETSICPICKSTGGNHYWIQEQFITSLKVSYVENYEMKIVK